MRQTSMQQLAAPSWERNQSVRTQDLPKPAWLNTEGMRRRMAETLAVLDTAFDGTDASSRHYLEKVAASDWSPFFRPLQSALEATSIMDGCPRIMLGANNYLGLTTDPRVVSATTEAVRACGTGCTGSRLMNGTLQDHLDLEEGLARFVGKEAALVFSAGFLANLGVLSTLATRETYFISDKLNHASICEGLMGSLAQTMRFAHNDPEALERRLAKLPMSAPRWIVIEGVHSMLGDVCPLPEMVAVAQKYEARLILDDAHGVGVVGRGGRGTASSFGLTEEVDIITGTFSKSFASYGGFVAADRETIEGLRYAARAFIFTASLPPANVATVGRVLEILEAEPEIVERLRRKTRYLVNRLREAGVCVRSPEAAIVPLILGPNDVAWKAWKLLYDAGVYTNVAFPPGVPPGQALLRISMMASMDEDVLDYTAEAVATAFELLEVSPC